MKNLYHFLPNLTCLRVRAWMLYFLNIISIGFIRVQNFFTYLFQIIEMFSTNLTKIGGFFRTILGNWGSHGVWTFNKLKIPHALSFTFSRARVLRKSSLSSKAVESYYIHRWLLRRFITSVSKQRCCTILLLLDNLIYFIYFLPLFFYIFLLLY